MVNQIPDSWEYNESLEMLFLFYQCADELLSETTTDTYSLPLHNAYTLIFEMQEVYSLLNKYGIVAEYFDKYIPPIIEEYLHQVENDYIYKKIMGDRLDSIKTGFKEAKSNPKLLERWIEYSSQICSIQKYYLSYKDEIINIVINSNDKKKLMYCVANYFIILRTIGYSREYLYTTTKRFFSNNKIHINNLNQITDFLGLFTFKKQQFFYLVLMDIDSIEYMDSIDGNLVFSDSIEKIDIEKEKQELSKDTCVASLIKEYESRQYHASKHEKLAVVRFTQNDYDPYSGAKQFIDYLSFLQAFTRYFKHFFYSKQVHRILQKVGDSYYREIKLPHKLQKRPFIEQDLIDSRIKNIISANMMDFYAFDTIAQAIQMHADAFDSRNTMALLKTFWTALETLFINPNSSHDNVIISIIPIIQKTYLLKKLRTVYLQLANAVLEEDLIKYEINSFKSFIVYFSSEDENSSKMKEIYKLLSNNPLLRSRIYELRKELKNGVTIKKSLEEHEKKIEWQLKRLYRMRNITTHLGTPVFGMEVAVNHLHNYFDYAVNYMLCKAENGEYVISTSAVVFEVKNDNRIHMEMLKSQDLLSIDNYIKYLFGPDKNLINYKFE